MKNNSLKKIEDLNSKFMYKADLNAIITEKCNGYLIFHNLYWLRKTIFKNELLKI